MEDKSALRRRNEGRARGMGSGIPAGGRRRHRPPRAGERGVAGGGDGVCLCQRRCEVDTRALIEAALREGKRVCAPRCLGKGAHGGARDRIAGCTRARRPWAVGARGELGHRAAGEIGLILVPCLAADRNGHRLGYGGGYYDRFLRGAAGASMCLCRARALLEDVPREEHDAAADMVVSEAGIAVCGKRGCANAAGAGLKKIGVCVLTSARA